MPFDRVRFAGLGTRLWTPRLRVSTLAGWLTRASSSRFTRGLSTVHAGVDLALREAEGELRRRGYRTWLQGVAWTAATPAPAWTSYVAGKPRAIVIN